jgi:hypothetical protein
MNLFPNKGGAFPMTISETYLELGLIGLGRSGEKPGWFGGHYGAALLAGYYMNREYDLPEHVREGIVRTSENFISKRAEFFLPYDNEQPDPALMEKVIAGLQANADRLSHSGHGLAYGFLALKALLDRPDLCIPSIVNGLYNTLIAASQGHGNRYYGIEEYADFGIDQVTDIPEYHGLKDMITTALAECGTVIPDATVDGNRYHFTGEVEHGLTHAQALVEFNRLGYDHLTQPGMVNHRIQMQLNRQLPEELLATEIKEPSFSTLFAEEYWGKTYDDPHALKIPYAALFLVNKLPAEQRAAAEKNVCKILCQMK